jgi:quinol monooxygenase YgiN
METTSTTAAAVITHKVKDYGVWRAGFDAHGPARKQAGILGHHVNRTADDPNTVSIYLAAGTQDELRAFAASPSLKEVMQSAGVVSEPVVMPLLPQEDRTIKKPTAGVIAVHDVADYATWKLAFDKHDAARKQAGIIGYAVNRRADNPNTVVIYMQAESLAELRAFVSSADLKATMQQAGVVGAPRITFVEGQDWASYA